MTVWYLQSADGSGARTNAASAGAHDESGAHKYTNRLLRSKSPYLLQHAHNPVDWHEWGEEAFSKARTENKPIFLSVGYSTCHWCHVMERESFENPDIAQIMNEHFVNIKVDREERPDVDRVYMTFVQATTGGGGWPMSVWLTPDLKPFFGGTYYPPEDRWGRRGFPSILKTIAGAWQNQRQQLLTSSEDVTRRLREHTQVRGTADVELERRWLETTYQQIKSSYEPRHGGFGGAPKFPRPVSLNFMLRYHARTGTKDALDMSLFTLRKMAEGGLHDHLGGGFHRYSVDDRWHVPHFEKMLYDQAQLACSYLEAYQITDEEYYANVARDVLDYVRRDMTGRHGQFHSAEDADSPLPDNPADHAEGAFYVWEEKEIMEAVGKDSAEIFCYYYGVGRGGNVREDPHGEFPKKNVLIVSRTLEETAKKFDSTPDQVRTTLAEARKNLLEIRSKRPRPHLDDKTLTAWNGLMISAFARAHQVLDEPQYLAAAESAAAFLKTQLYDEKIGKLSRRHREGQVAFDGYVDDYAFLIQGLLDLYEASFNVEHLQWALNLQRKQNELFWDKEHAGFFSTAGKDPSILLRMKEDYDGAEPSPNSVAVLNLLRLAEMLDRQEFRGMAEKTLAAFGPRLSQAPSALPQMMVAFEFHLSKPKQIVIAGKPDAGDTRAMLNAVHREFIPNKILLLADGGESQAFLGKHLEFIQSVKSLEGKATAYVCENYVCRLPTTDLSTMKSQLTKSKTERPPKKG
ncbi:MAG: thioredoxin domain-containing protein [Chloroflexi bacterium]|nr:thioredoxin domain-containing protein [Chloroflexota bacterium]